MLLLNLVYFPNLKSLILTQCLLTESLIKTLSILIKYQLDEFTLTFDKDAIELIPVKIIHKIIIIKLIKYSYDKSSTIVVVFLLEKLLTLYKELITQIFSNDCQLTSLRLDIACADGNEHPHQCLKPRFNLSSCQIINIFKSDDLRNNALGTIRFAEFTIPSCHRGLNGLIHIGKKLVPFLSTYMPHLQTLCLWRPDDFPWTSSM